MTIYPRQCINTIILGSIIAMGLGACTKPLPTATSTYPAQDTVPLVVPQQEPAKASFFSSDRVRIGPGDLFDAATTAWGLSRPGIEEANPLLAWSGDAAPIAAIGLKYGAKHALVSLDFDPATANRTVESFSAGAGCANVVTITSATGPGAVVAGLGCALLYNHLAKRELSQAKANI